MSYDIEKLIMPNRSSQVKVCTDIVPSRSTGQDDGKVKSNNGNSRFMSSSYRSLSTNNLDSHFKKNKCYKHNNVEEIVSVCTLSKCQKRGAICPQCQVKDHYEHLGHTWNLQDYLVQVESQVQDIHPGTFELNKYFIDLKTKIRQAKNSLIEQIENIDLAVNKMTKLVKENFDKDIDNVRANFGQFDKQKNCDLIGKVKQITQYFGIDPDTHQVYMSTAYKEFYNWKTADLLQEQIEEFDQTINTILKQLGDIGEKFNKFNVTTEIICYEEPKFQPQNLQVSHQIEMAHSNWIRGVQVFTLSDFEAQNLGLSTAAQIAKREPYNLEGLQAIVSTSDDMEIKIWVYFPDQNQYKVVSQINQAHAKEFLSMRVYFCDDSQLTGMIGGPVQCNNIIFTAEHGLIKVWDWVQRKCLNKIKTYTIFTYDFEVLRFQGLGVCYAQGSKNIIQVSDFTSPSGMLQINEICPQEQHKEITAFKKIPAGTVDLLVAGFSTFPGTIKVFNHSGICISRIIRPDQDMAFCFEQLMSLKRYAREKTQEILIVGSDAGCLSAYQINDGKTLWVNTHAHSSWIRGLTSLVVKDNYNFKRLVLSCAQNETCIKISEGLTGQILFEMKDVLDSGLRFRGMTCYQSIPDPKKGDQSVIVAGTMAGTLVILKMFE